MRDRFRRQAFMRAIGAELPVVAPGRVEIRLPWQRHLTAVDGGFDRGVIGTLADNAGGYAAFTLLPVRCVRAQEPAAPPRYLFMAGRVWVVASVR